MLRPEVERGEQEVVRLTQGQMGVLDMLRGQRRASIVGPAGSGKTMLAREKARRLAREGFRTLLVCFNQPLARTLADDLAGEPAPGGLTVSTFHELCLTLGREAGTLPPEPADKTQACWDEVLPRALDDALSVIWRPLSRDLRRRGPGLRPRLARLAVPGW
jgi:superfamily I DNA/RNA helicase